MGDNMYNALNISSWEADAWWIVHIIVLPQLARSLNIDTTQLADTTSKPLNKIKYNFNNN